MADNPSSIVLPTAEQVRRAVAIFLERAYGADVPPVAAKLRPPQEFEPVAWLMGQAIERDPADAPLEQVRSFALRLGNSLYPHMKLRLSRPPRLGVFFFSIDSHDAFLHAPAGSPDQKPLEELKRHNAALADGIMAAWDAESLPTERTYLRQKIQQARDAR